MSVKHVKKYYRDIEKMYLELVSELSEMKDDFAKGNCTEDELNNLLTPVKGIEELYYIHNDLFGKSVYLKKQSETLKELFDKLS